MHVGIHFYKYVTETGKMKKNKLESNVVYIYIYKLITLRTYVVVCAAESDFYSAVDLNM